MNIGTKRRTAPRAAWIAAFALLACAAAATAQERKWTTLAIITVDYPEKNIQKGVPPGQPNGPDAAIRKTFTIPSHGLLRVTHWEEPYYAYGLSSKDPNSGGLGITRGGDDTRIGAGVWETSEPKNPVNGQLLKTCFVREVDPQDAWVEVAPALHDSGYRQLRLVHKVLVEFSPGRPIPQEVFRAPDKVPALTPSSDSPYKDILGTWSVNGNGYTGKLELSVGSDGRLAARIYYDVAKKWESLVNVRYENKTLSFTRPWTNNPTFQQYVATFSGSSFMGTFTDNNTPGQKFNWMAAR